MTIQTQKNNSGETAIVQVAVEAAAPSFYSYVAKPPMSEKIEVGQMVLVSLGHRQTAGYVMGIKKNQAPLANKYKEIIEIIRQEPLFGPSLARLVGFISHYYLYPPGLCAKEILPGGLSPSIDKIAVLAEPQISSFLVGSEAELISRLTFAGSEGLDIKALEKEQFGPLLKKMIAGKKVTVKYRLGRSGARPKSEWWLGPALSVPDSPPRLGPKERELWELVKGGPVKPLTYYATYVTKPLAQARSLMAKGLAVLSQREIFRDDPDRAIFDGKRPETEPTPQQAKALAAIKEAIDGNKHKGFMLFGVTGSGKTEVYLRAAEMVLAQGRQVLWLAPEIGLTLGLEGLLKTNFPAEKVAVLHSGLTPGQRHDQWLRIRRGLSPIVLGARSAVFAPLENTGLVVVDEEHDWAYKQDDGLRYNGRDLARWRAVESNAVLILGSATPSFESYQAALDGRLTLLKMTNRPGTAVLPDVELVDQGAEPSRHRKAISPILQKRFGDTLARGEQALLFVNRRGLANLPMCLQCGDVLKCPHCSRTLTLHGPENNNAANNAIHTDIEDRQVLICHSCGYRANPPKACPACFSPLFRYFGVGTEKLLDLAGKAFPEARGERLDTDSVRSKGGLKKILGGFARGEFDYLVGTQMAAKGHDFPNLTLVGVVDADLGLNLPDFRAAERTFQLLSQVSGRAGRADRPGTVLIQTLIPRHPVLKAVVEHDYESFFASEIETRVELSYPPFSRLALVRLTGPDESELSSLSARAGELGRPLADSVEGELDFMGPVPSPLAKIKDRYRFQFLIRASSVHVRHNFLKAWLPEVRKTLPAVVRLLVDIDPYHLL